LNLWLGEFCGTLILILLGNGVVAGCLLNKSKSESAGWIVITAGWALAVFSGILVAQALGSPGGHLNPAVSLFSAIRSHDFSQLVTYWTAQFAGAIAGSVLVWLQYFPHWEATEDANLKLDCYCTAPAIRNAPFNAISEFIGTAVLLIVTSSLGSKGVGGLAPGLSAPLVGGVVWAIGLSLGGPTGYAINPARDLGPRIAHFLLPIAGKRDSNWSYAWVPVVGPLLAAVVCALLLPTL
jgi:glycerol uptake facilitator protein